MELNTERSYRLRHNENVFSKLIRLFSTREKTEFPGIGTNGEIKELLENIKIARNEWTNANMNFEFATEQEMVDYYTYKIKACEVRYEYLLKKAKEMGIKSEHIDSEGLSYSQGGVKG